MPNSPPASLLPTARTAFRALALQVYSAIDQDRNQETHNGLWGGVQRFRWFVAYALLIAIVALHRLILVCWSRGPRDADRSENGCDSLYPEPGFRSLCAMPGKWSSTGREGRTNCELASNGTWPQVELHSVMTSKRSFELGCQHSPDSPPLFVSCHAV